MSCSGREARLGPGPPPALLGGWYTARTYGPWVFFRGDSGPRNHPAITVYPLTTGLIPLPPLSQPRLSGGPTRW